MKYYLLLAIVAFSAKGSFSQQSWKKGWCVTQEGDTLHGQIQFQDWDISPVQVTFRDSISKKETIFGVGNIKSFALDDGNLSETFEAKRVKVTTYFTSPVVEGNKTATIDTLTRFVELKFRSTLVSLYMLLDDNKVPHFYLLKDSIVTELLYGTVILIRHGKHLNYTNNAFRGQLKILLQECPTLDVTYLPYTEKNLIKLLTEYHSYCKVDYRIMFSNEGRAKVNFGIASGGFFPLQARVYRFDLATRFLVPKRFHNRFIIVKGGIIVSDYLQVATLSGDVRKYLVNLSAYAGTYFGNDGKVLLPFVYGGLSTRYGLNAGAGISFRKKIDLSIYSKIGKDSFLGFEVNVFPF